MGGKVIFIAPLFVLHVESRKKYTGGMKMNLPPMARYDREPQYERGRSPSRDVEGWGREPRHHDDGYNDPRGGPRRPDPRGDQQNYGNPRWQDQGVDLTR